jgi:Tfp pilus assembly protein PilX
MKQQPVRRMSERGVALILALLALLALSMLAAALVFVTQTQIWTSYNYRLTTQARYAAEAGIQRTMNWLSSSSYAAPTNFTYFNLSQYPVQCSSAAVANGLCNSGPVVLSANTTGLAASNYPDSTTYPNPTGTVETAFSAALGNQSITTSITGETFSTSATLLSMSSGSGVSWLGGGGGVVQTWQITSLGNIASIRSAQVQVVATYTRSGTSIFSDAVFATGTGCAAINLTGSFTTDSYTSANGPYNSSTNHSATNGNLGTNGNLTSTGAGTLNGTLYDPNGNTTGPCPKSYTNTGSISLTGGITPLPAAVTYPTPTAPSPTPPTTAQSPAVIAPYCSGFPSGCTASSSSNITLAPGTYGSVSFTGAYTLNLSAGTYNLNSLTFTGSNTVNLTSGPVILNFSPSSATPLDLTGASITNATGQASNLQIVYGGTGTLKLTGATNSAGVVYAPNAAVTLTGASGWQGAIISKTFTDTGSTGIHYDRALQNSLTQVGNFVPVAFSWSKF